MQKLSGVAAIVIIAAILWLLLFLYGNLSLYGALGESIAYTVILAVSGFLYQYIRDYLKALQAKIVVALVVQLITLAGTFALTSLMGQEAHALFASNIVLHLVFGLLCWTIIELWYYNYIKEDASEDCMKDSVNASEKSDIIDHIPERRARKLIS